MRNLSLVVTLLLAVIAAGCDNPNAQELLARGKQAREKGDNNAAAILLSNALRENPAIAEARYLLGVIKEETGDLGSSEAELRRAQELGFDAAKVRLALARTLLKLGQYQKALDEATSVPDSAETLVIRGLAHLGLGAAAQAASAFEDALKLNADFVPALLGQVQQAMAERKLDRATALLNDVRAKAPNNPVAWFMTAELYRSQANYPGAVAAYGEVLRIEPRHLSARIGRASLLADTGKFDDAQSDIDAARKISPGRPLVEYTAALLLFRQGKFEPALAISQKVLAAVPNHMPSILLAGLSHYSLNSLTQAERHIKQFLDNDPDSLFARKLLVKILLKEGQGKRALDTLQPALKTKQPDAQVLALAGEAYIQARQYAQATEYLKRAASMAPTDADLRVRLGMSALAMGETQRAVAELEAAGTLARELTPADSLLVMTYLRTGNYDKALEAGLKLAKKQPGNPMVHDLLGGTYLARKDSVNARKSFERALAVRPDYMPAALMLARMDLEARNVDAARARFKAILDKNGKNVQAMLGLASIERATGNPGAYADWLEKARKANATDLMPRLLLVRHYLLVKNTKDALAVAVEAKGLQPRHPDVLNLLGEAQSASGEKDAAVATYSSLVSVVPNSPLAHYRLATAYFALENHANAGEALRKALKLKPDYVDAKAALALVEYRAEKYGESLKLAQQIQRDAPKLPTGYTLEGDSLMAQKKFTLAEHAFQKAFAIRKSSALAIKLHAAASQAGQVKEANARLAQWVREHPEDIAARLFLADAYVKRSENQLAIQQYELVLKKEPKNLIATSNLAAVYRAEKDPRALEYFERSYKLKPDNAVTTHSLGWVLVEEGQLKRGLALLQEASQRSPHDPELRYHLAVALFRSGDKVQARRELEGLLADRKSFPSRDQAQELLKQM